MEHFILNHINSSKNYTNMLAMLLFITFPSLVGIIYDMVFFGTFILQCYVMWFDMCLMPLAINATTYTPANVWFYDWVSMIGNIIRICMVYRHGLREFDLNGLWGFDSGSKIEQKS